MTKDSVSLGIVGTGSRGTGSFWAHMNARDDVSIAALCDPNPVRLRAAREQMGIESNLYESVEAMLSRETLDAVIVTSPDCTHEANAVAALRRGLDVFVDKPLSTTANGCRNIIRAAEKAGRTVMVGFNMRHEPTVRRVKSLIDEGAVGDVFLIENREFYGGGRTYMSRWNRKYDISGGLWVHKGSHDFDVFNWFLGFPRPAKVSATGGLNILNPEHLPFETEPDRQVGPTCRECAYSAVCPDRYDVPEDGMWGEEARKADGYAKDLCMYTSDKDVHDNGIAWVEYENGARASHLECFITPISDRLYTVVGERGQIEASLHNRTIVVRPRWSRETITYDVPEVTGGHGGSDPGLAETFIEVAKGACANTSTAKHGLLSTAIGEAAELSWREERVVRIDELAGT